MAEKCGNRLMGFLPAGPAISSGRAAILSAEGAKNNAAWFAALFVSAVGVPIHVSLEY